VCRCEDKGHWAKARTISRCSTRSADTFQGRGRRQTVAALAELGQGREPNVGLKATCLTVGLLFARAWTCPALRTGGTWPAQPTPTATPVATCRGSSETQSATTSERTPALSASTTVRSRRGCLSIPSNHGACTLATSAPRICQHFPSPFLEREQEKNRGITIDVTPSLRLRARLLTEVPFKGPANRAARWARNAECCSVSPPTVVL